MKIEIMKNVILFILILLGLLSIACQDITVGYLVVENAGYDPDTMIVRRELDLEDREIINPEWQERINQGLSPERLEEWGIPKWVIVNGEDFDRNRLETPWSSTKIQGVEGTQQIYVTISKVTTDSGNVGTMLKLLTVRGDGTLQLPTHINDLPAGRYVISLDFTNEGYSKNVNDCFTIIVK